MSLDKILFKEELEGAKIKENVDSKTLTNVKDYEQACKKYDSLMQDDGLEKAKEKKTSIELNIHSYDLLMNEVEEVDISEYNRMYMDYSEGIMNNVSSIEEYQVYQKAGLQEVIVGDKIALVKGDIDWGKRDYMGRSNKERVEQGLSPIDSDERPIELHHIGQHQDSPLAELTMAEHRGKGNDSILHNKMKESEIDRQEFSRERNNHWLKRAEQVA